MAYRKKIYVVFDVDDIIYFNMFQAWCAGETQELIHFENSVWNNVNPRKAIGAENSILEKMRNVSCVVVLVIQIQSGEIVIEVPNSYTTNPQKIDPGTFYGKFLEEYHRINKSEALLQIIKKNLSSNGFKPDKKINAHSDQERYELGSFCTIEFNGKKYLLASSYKTDINHSIISTSVSDYNIFLCNLWANLSKIGADRKVLDIPIFGNKSQPYMNKITTEKMIYQILKTYIYNSKKNSPCAKELHICFYDDKENEKDLDKYVTIAKFLDEFRTEEREDKDPQGTGLE